MTHAAANLMRSRGNSGNQTTAAMPRFIVSRGR
jgi:hypothetical protein